MSFVKTAGILVIVSTLLFPGMAACDSISEAVGKGRRWVKIGEDGEWRGTFDALAGVSYNRASSEGDGWTFAWKTGGAGHSTVNRYSVGRWWVKGGIEPFVDVALNTWGKRLTGDFELLGGGEVGVRFNVGAPTFQLSGSMAGGKNGNRDAWVYFGVYVRQGIGEGDER